MFSTLESKLGFLRRVYTSLSPPERTLLLMAGLPLIDGVFASKLATGAFSSLPEALGFGCTIFSGAGCIGAALTLDGSVRGRALSVLKIYLLVILPGVLLTQALLPVLRLLFAPGFEVFSALVIAGIALQLLGLKVAPYQPPPSSAAALWTWSFRLVGVPQAVLSIAILGSLMTLPQRGIQLSAFPSWNEVLLALMAAAAGLCFTLVPGAVVGGLLRSYLNPAWTSRGGAVALALIGLSILKAPIPQAAPFVALLAGLIIGAIATQLSRGGPPSNSQALSQSSEEERQVTADLAPSRT